MSAPFYVYMLFRPDTGAPLYVGKGQGRRVDVHLTARSKNLHLQRIIDKAKRDGLDVPRVKLAQNLNEADAFAIERLFIATIGRSPNGPLVNLTDGGEGLANPSPATRAKISASKTNPSEAIRATLRTAKAGRKDLSPEARARIGAASRIRKFSPEVLAKMSAKRLGVPWSEARRARKLAPRSAESRARSRLAVTAAWARRKAAQDAG